MPTQALLSSKIVINEEPPQIRSITAQPTAVLGMVGIAQRGPIGQPTLCLSFEEWRSIFGNYTADSRDTVAAVEGFFEEGGQYLWFSRTAHYNDITDATTVLADIGTVDLDTNALAAAGATLLAGNVGPYNLAPGDTITFDVSGGGDDTATIDATAPLRSAAAGPYNLSDGQTLTISVNGGPVQTLTLAAADFGNIAAATAAELVIVIERDLAGIDATDNAGTLELRTDGQGTGFSLNVTGGTANGVLAFTTGVLAGTGDVANIDAVSIAELITVIQADVAGVTVTNVDNRLQVATTATGVATTLQVTGGTALAAFDFPTGLVTGNDAAAATATLRVDGKYPGAYTDDVTVTIAAASSGEADRFNLTVLVEGVGREVFHNVSMDDADSNYVETVVNATGTGSQLITVTDLDAFGATATATAQRPANAAGVVLVGGDDGLVGLADSDFIGDADEKTGFYALDADTSQPVTLLACPARATAAVHNAMLNYCEVSRAGSVFAIIDSPAGLTAQGILDYVRNQALLENASEFGAIYYPLVRVINPNTALFGDEAWIEVPPCGHIAGVMARTDSSAPGGVYRSPAGHQNGRLRSIVGFEILPGRQQPETFDETKRDLIYPARINPLDAQGGIRHIDGGRTLSGAGNFPNVGERRGASFIEQTIKVNLEFARHRNNDEALRAEVTRVVEKFLLDQMRVGAFRTRSEDTAFFVDFGRGLNPDSVIFAGQLIGRIGLATNKPAEFIILNFTQDTRALQQELSQ